MAIVLQNVSRSTSKVIRYQYLGFMIEKWSSGWHVVDWDYESETTVHVARSESAALDYCDRHC